MVKLWNKLVNIFFIPLVVISLMGSISLLLGQITSASTVTIIILNVIWISGVIIYLLHEQYKKIGDIILKCLKRHVKIIKLILIILLVLWQLYLIVTISGKSEWDPGNILLAAMRKKGQFPHYFSYYPNTLFLLFYEHFIWIIFGKPNIVAFTMLINVVNLIIFDLSLVLLYKFVNHKLGRLTANVTIFLSCCLIGITPWYCIPYSDILSFSFCIFSIIVLEKLFVTNKLEYASLSGLLLLISYLIKPSLAIVYIAFVILYFGSGHIVKEKFVNIFAIALIFVAGTALFNCYKINNNLVKLDTQKSFSMYHYADIGIYGNGGYNTKDFYRDADIKSANQRKKLDIEVWKQRYSKRGFIGYERFLINKQVTNTHDVSFGWGKEGGFLTSYSKHNGFSKIAFSLFAKNGSARKYNNTVLALGEIIWVFVFLGLCVNFVGTSYFVLFLKYSLVGFFVFLLIFEGGRSRYIIQFLPLIFVLSSLGWAKLIKHVSDDITFLDKNYVKTGNIIEK